MSGVLVVGAGPAGLACALALRCHGVDTGLEVVDPAGSWLTAWARRFRAQDIPHLRSPSVHHPHPDPFALLRFAEGGGGLVRSGGTQLPTTDLFQRFVHDAVVRADLSGRVAPVGVARLEVSASGAPTVWLTDGSVRTPDRVVLATNTRHPVVPTPLCGLLGDADRSRRDPDPRAGPRSVALTPPPIVLGDAADVRMTPMGGHVVIVGGGLSAAHLAIGVARRGAHVTMLTRRRLMVRRFDTHPSWLGPKKRRPFEREPDPQVRRRAIDEARGGGSLPHRYRRQLEELEAAGCLTLRERCRPLAVDPGSRSALQIRGDDGAAMEADMLWLATGGQVDVRRDPLCASLIASHPTPVVDGLPELDPDLSWPGTRVHLTGFAAALVLGPTAGNLVGHRRAALRLVGRLRGLDPAQADRVATGPGACPR